MTGAGGGPGGDEVLARLDSIEKRLALYDLIASYGPAVDSGRAEAAAQMWVEDGVYDFGEVVLEGRGEIMAMVEGRPHQGLIAGGAAHMLGLPKIIVDGDRAVVTGYSQVCRHRNGAYEVWRVSANRWELTYRDEGWQVDQRRAHLLNGQEAARALLGRSEEVAGAE